MTITVAILIAILFLFALNLIVLIAFIGPILTEVRLILSDVRKVTDTVENRVGKIDEFLANLSTGFAVFKQVKKFAGKFAKKNKSDEADSED